MPTRVRTWKMLLGAAIVSTVLAVGTSSTSAQTTPTPPTTLAPTTDVTAVVQQLRKGGYVMLFRHGPTDFSQAQLELDNFAANKANGFTNCATQRLLSDAGRAQMTSVGTALTKTRIPVASPVRSSPLCRTKETAQLLFPKAKLKVEPLLEGVPPGTPTTLEQDSAVAALLSKKPPKKKNQVLVSHSENILKATGELLGEGEALILKPNGSTFTVIAKIPFASWLV